MRNLTIKREKSFVACLATMKVYIEDQASGQLMINNVLCSKLGELKNGEEKTFLIGNGSAKVFVIADKLSKNYCNEYYQIDEGDYDVLLIGRNYFNLANGNAFRFHNNETTAVLENRKKSTRIGLVVMISALLVGILFGLFLINFDSIFKKEPQEKVFRADSLQITLTDEFKERKDERAIASFDSKNIGIIVSKEDFSLHEKLSSYSVQQYGNIYVRLLELYDSPIQTENDLTYFEYDGITEDGTVYLWRAYIYKSETAFYLVQFVTKKDQAAKYQDTVGQFASSVCFPDEK